MTAPGIGFAATRPSQAEAADHGPRQGFITALICDNALLCAGLREILAGTTFVIAEGRAVSNPRLVLEQGEEPALVIIEASQSSIQTALEMARLAKESCPAARVVALADQVDLIFVHRGLAAGLDGFCLTGADSEVLIRSLELVMLGETVLPSAITRSLLDEAAKSQLSEPQEGAEVRSHDLGTHKLSARETEVLTCLMGGASNKIIARRLDVTEATIKVHVKAVLRKIGAANRTQAAMWATEHLPTNARASLIT